MLRLIGTELFKLRKRTMTWILLYILVGLMIVVHLLTYAISRTVLPSQGPPGMDQMENLLGLPISIPFSLSMIMWLGSVLAVILMASAAGNEFNWRTIRLALISAESRFKFLAAKLIAVIILAFIGMLIGLIVGFIMSLITTALGGYAFDFGFATRGYLWDQFLQFWRTFFVILVFILMGLLFAILGRSAMPGIAVGIGILFLEPIITALMGLAGGWIANIPDYLFSANVNTINDLNNLPGGFGGGGPFGGDQDLPSATWAFTVLGLYGAFFAVLAFYLFHRRDVTG